MSHLWRSWYEQQRARYLHRRGLDAMGKGNMAVAIATLTAALSHHRNPAQLHLALGQLHWQRGKLASAIAAFSQAIAQDSACVSAYCSRGYLRMFHQQAELALADWQRGLELSPGHPTIHYYRGLWHADQGQPAAALADFDAALASDPNLASAYLQRGHLRYQQGHRELAQQDWQLALVNDPSLEEARQLLEQCRQHHQTRQLDQRLGTALGSGLRVETQQRGSQLHVDLYRPKGMGINYLTLPQQLRQHLVALELSGVRTFQLTGRVNGQSLPEWQQSYPLYHNLPCPPMPWGLSLAATALAPPLGAAALVYGLRGRQAHHQGDYPAALRSVQVAQALGRSGSALGAALLLLMGGYSGVERLQQRQLDRLARLEQADGLAPGVKSARSAQRADESRDYPLNR